MLEDKFSSKYAGSVIAAYLTVAFKQPETSVDAIAIKMGHPNSRFLASVARGEHRLPIDVAPALAHALGADPLHVLAMSMRAYSEELADLLDGYRAAAKAEKLTATVEVEL